MSQSVGTPRIRLLGKPSIEPGLPIGQSGSYGVHPSPRGRKSWGLLAYLLLVPRPVFRRELAELLFEDADDPRNALRWNLAELRRALGPEVRIEGDPVRLELPAGTWFDVRDVTAPGVHEDASAAIAAGELLEGLDFDSVPVFDMWLSAERRRLAGVVAAVLRERAHASLAAGDGRRAAELARRLLASDALDEDTHELLVRALVAAGDVVGARAQQERAESLIRRELGVEPGRGLRTASERSGATGPLGGNVQATTEAALQAGEAAIAAGAAEAGIRSLRDAVSGSANADAMLRARALVSLGSALVHALRGLDGEAAAVLQEAVSVGRDAGDAVVAARASRELGYVEMLRGRYDRADRWLEEAAELATTHPEELAWARAVRGAAQGDRGLHEQALAELDVALEIARVHNLSSVEAWALAFIGRSRLLRDELDQAAEALTDAVAACARASWTAFLPLPLALLGDVLLATGRLDDAEATYGRAFALAVQLDDPCWEGLAGRGLGLASARRGSTPLALDQLNEARRRCVRVPDAWLWVEAYCLDALAAVGTDADPQAAHAWVADLEAVASRTGMRELVARAFLHRARLGDPNAGRTAAMVSADVENPALQQQSVTAVETSHVASHAGP